MGTSRLRVAAALGTCAALVVLTACGGGSQPARTDQPTDPGKPTTSEAAAIEKYGLPAVKDPKTTYQPDVVFIDNGPQAIREVSPSGLVWTLDGSAKGISDLVPGKIMFASQHAVGRVMEVRKNGGDVQVMLAPVLINEIVKDGVIKVDSVLDMNAMTFDASPEAPGAFTDLSKNATASPTPSPTSPRSRRLPDRITLPALRPAAMVQGGLPLRAPNTSTGKVTLGNWEAQMKKDQPNEVSLQLQRSGKLGGETVRGGITVKLRWKDPHVQVNMPISNGQVSKSSSYSLSGLEAITGGWEFAGLEQSKGRFEIPIDVPFGPAFVGPVPVSAVIKVKALVTFGITSKKSTVTGQITHPISGSLGTGSAPKASTLGKILDKVHNVAVGPFGVLFAFEFKVIVGVGVPQFISGIYGKMVVSWGMTHSGGLGIAMCDSAAINISFAAGVGANVSANVLKEFPGRLPQVLSKKTLELWEKWKAGFDVEQSILNSGDLLVAEEYEPKIAACKP